MNENSKENNIEFLIELEKRIVNKEIKILWDDYYRELEPRINSLYCGDKVENKEVYEVNLIKLMWNEKNEDNDKETANFLSQSQIKQQIRENELNKNAELLGDFNDKILIEEMKRRRDLASAEKRKAEDKKNDLNKAVYESNEHQ